MENEEILDEENLKKLFPPSEFDEIISKTVITPDDARDANGFCRIVPLLHSPALNQNQNHMISSQEYIERLEKKLQINEKRRENRVATNPRYNRMNRSKSPEELEEEIKREAKKKEAYYNITHKDVGSEYGIHGEFDEISEEKVPLIKARLKEDLDELKQEMKKSGEDPCSSPVITEQSKRLSKRVIFEPVNEEDVIYYEKDSEDSSLLGEDYDDDTEDRKRCCGCSIL